MLLVPRYISLIHITRKTELLANSAKVAFERLSFLSKELSSRFEKLGSHGEIVMNLCKILRRKL